MVSDIRDSNAFGTLTSVENLSFGRRTSIINQSERIDSKTENLLNLIFLNRNGFRKKNPIFQFLDFYKNGRSQKEKSFIWRKIEWLSTRGQGRRKKVNWVFHGKNMLCHIFLDFGRVMWAEEGKFHGLITLIWPEFPASGSPFLYSPSNDPPIYPLIYPDFSGGLGLISVVLISAILAGSGCHVLKKDTQENINELNKFITNLKGTVQKISSRVLRTVHMLTDSMDKLLKMTKAGENGHFSKLFLIFWRIVLLCETFKAL